MDFESAVRQAKKLAAENKVEYLAYCAPALTISRDLNWGVGQTLPGPAWRNYSIVLCLPDRDVGEGEEACRKWVYKQVNQTPPFRSPRMTTTKILPVATIDSLIDARFRFASFGGDENALVEFAAAALSAWQQGLISCHVYADCCEEMAAGLRAYAARRRAA